MLKASCFLLALLMVASAQDLRGTPNLKIRTEDVYEFLGGFMNGLEGKVSTPGPCYQALLATNEDFVAIISDVVRVVNGDSSAVAQLITDSEALLPLLLPLESQCQWGLLVNQTKALIAGGYSTILLRYSMHIKTMTADILTIKNCNANYTACGYAAGEIIRIELNWKLNSNLKADPKPKPTGADLFELLAGMLSGLEGPVKTPGKCYTAISGSSETIGAIVSDVSRILDGDYSAVSQLIVDIEALKPELEPISQVCDWKTFVTAVNSSIHDYKAVVLRYTLHAKEVDKDLDSVKDCSANYTACGYGMGDIIRILISWNLNNPQLHAANYETTVKSWAVIATGFLSGLEGPNTTPGPCYVEIEKLGNLLQTLFTEGSSIFGGNFNVVQDFINNAKGLVPEEKAISNICPFKGLVESIKNIMKPDGYKTVLLRYYKYYQSINADIATIEQCSADYLKCGESAGNIAFILLNWNLQ
mmetsp:Transcript_1006/g.998  ORF Transcript_1006/g.998 Transcript_1006/m.998 type:complete len:474 (-) Transcript_1006:35-1456(-)